MFERLNQNPKSVTEKQPTGFISESAKEHDVLYRQISECLEQWPAKKSQNYFELKHHFELLHILRSEQYKSEAFAFISKRAMEVLAASKISWSFVRKATVYGAFFDILLTGLNLPKFLSVSHGHFDVVQG